MSIRVIGLNNRIAPIGVRELFSFDASGVTQSLLNWREQFPNIESVLVSTCNRTELYFAADRDDLPEYQNVFPFLISPKYSHSPREITFERFKTNFQTFEDMRAAERLFSVASSLDSMILGEPQILSQMKRAYELATEAHTTGPVLNDAFQTAFKTAKRISVETDVFRRRVSVPSVAVVDFALKIFERLDDKQTLVLGAGEMAEETLKYLSDYGARSVLVANRSPQKAEFLATKWNGSVVDWEGRAQALALSDLVIVATGASDPVITLNDYLAIESQRKSGKSLFILDLAVPRNVDPLLSKRPNVFLYSVDDLEAACVHNKKLRDQEIPKARRIVLEETEKFIANINARRSIDAIRQLRDSWNDVKNTELERLLRKIDCSAHTEKEIRYAFDRLVNKLLHQPTVSLRSASQNESGQRLAETLKKLFRL